MIELWEKSKHPRAVVIGFVEHKEERAGVSELRDCSGELSTPSAGFPDSSFCPNCRRLIASGP
jgi:hypothetical protein